MSRMWRRLAGLLWRLPLLLVAAHTLIRVIRHFRKFPMPRVLANAIDNPLRRRLQPPDQTPRRHGLVPGMRVLEIGPGNGTYTLATAQYLGPAGQLVTIDIEPKMIERVQRRMEAEGVTNVDARWANVYDLPFEDASFDAAYMIAVYGEIPKPAKALRELHRVLSPSGTLAISELLADPDYMLARNLIRQANRDGFRLKTKLGNALYYTLLFCKASSSEPEPVATGANQ